MNPRKYAFLISLFLSASSFTSIAFAEDSKPAQVATKQSAPAEGKNATAPSTAPAVNTSSNVNEFAQGHQRIPETGGTTPYPLIIFAVVAVGVVGYFLGSRGSRRV